MTWWRGLGPLLVLPCVAWLIIPPTWPRWAAMWTLALAIYVGCKWLTWRTQATEAAWWRHAGYLLAWPGLDAASFLDSTTTPLRKPVAWEWVFAASKLALGGGLLFGAARMMPQEYSYLVGWVGMIGIVMMLHFGAFHLLSCAWRRAGVEARPLMNWPAASVSVSEFWGRRWNTAFRDLTHRFLFRPLTTRFGPRRAIFMGFVFSGVVHDLVISLPAGGGYGGPSLFFLLQGVAIFVERSAIGRRAGLGRGLRGWAFTACVLLAPARLLFHRPFVEEVVVPFMWAVGAIG